MEDAPATFKIVCSYDELHPQCAELMFTNWCKYEVLPKMTHVMRITYRMLIYWRHETKAVHNSLSHYHTLQLKSSLVFLILKVISREFLLCVSVLKRLLCCGISHTGQFACGVHQSYAPYLIWCQVSDFVFIKVQLKIRLFVLSALVIQAA